MFLKRLVSDSQDTEYSFNLKTVMSAINLFALCESKKILSENVLTPLGDGFSSFYYLPNVFPFLCHFFGNSRNTVVFSLWPV